LRLTAAPASRILHICKILPGAGKLWASWKKLEAGSELEAGTGRAGGELRAGIGRRAGKFF